MENKKLIKSIRKKVVKQFKNDLKNSVLKELYEGMSKKEIKSLKKQILKDAQSDIFGSLGVLEQEIEQATSPESLDEKIIKNDIPVIEPEISEEISKISEIVEKAIDDKSRSNVYEHLGFKFDSNRMSSLVTGKTRGTKGIFKEGGVERTNDKKSIVQNTFPLYPNSWLNPSPNLESAKKVVDEIKSGNHKDFIKKSIEKVTPPVDGFTPIPLSTSAALIRNKQIARPSYVPSTRNLIKYDERLTPSEKEDLAFFIEKLKLGISKLGKGQKNINYRHSSGDIYAFSYSKSEVGSEGFTLSFDVDLNIKTLRATIKDFRFNIDGFKFDSHFFETIDIVRVLDFVGMNISNYVNEISGINSTESKTEISPSKKSKYKSDTKIESIIKDARIISILHKNDIVKYEDLLKFNSDYTTIKGIGEKNAKKIKQYIK